MRSGQGHKELSVHISCTSNIDIRGLGNQTIEERMQSSERMGDENLGALWSEIFEWDTNRSVDSRYVCDSTDKPSSEFLL